MNKQTIKQTLPEDAFLSQSVIPNVIDTQLYNRRDDLCTGVTLINNGVF